MLPSSVAIVVASALLTVLAVGAFAFAWRRGHFRDLEAQGRVILEPRDLRLLRPWESPVQRLERESAYGPGEAPPPGEWGGAA